MITKFKKHNETYIDNFSIFHVIDNMPGLEIQKYLKDNPNKINDKNTYGNTALHITVQREQGGIVTMLLDSGANPNIKNNLGEIPLILSTNYDILTKLLEHGSKFDIFVNGKSFIETLSWPTDEEIYKYLEENRPEEYKKYLLKKKYKI